MKGRKTMTSTIKNKSYKHGWNAIVKALTDGNDMSGFADKIAKTQAEHDANSGPFHYAEGARACLLQHESTGEIPAKEE